MKHDGLADTFNIIKFTESIGRKECLVPSSKLTEGVLRVIKNNGYISGYEPVSGVKGKKFRVFLNGMINDCNVVRPRFSMAKNEMTKWEKKFLPADNIGTLLLTTPMGITDQREAKKSGTGGKILGYIY